MTAEPRHSKSPTMPPRERAARALDTIKEALVELDFALDQSATVDEILGILRSLCCLSSWLEQLKVLVLDRTQYRARVEARNAAHRE